MTAGRPAPRQAGRRRGLRAVRARVVALGGGHGLAASLSALRRVTDELTAVVTVSDDGGSSGRLRDEFGVLPPGDLRKALAALCGDDEWGRTWARVVQHRFESGGDAARPRARQPADRRDQRTARRPGGRPRPGRRAAARARPGAADVGGAARHRGRGRRASTARAAASAPSAARSRSPPPAARCVGRWCRRPAGLPRGGRPRCSTPTGWCSARARGSPSVLPHLLVPELREALIDDRPPRRRPQLAPHRGRRRLLAGGPPRGAGGARARTSRRRRPRRREGCCQGRYVACSG